MCDSDGYHSYPKAIYRNVIRNRKLNSFSFSTVPDVSFCSTVEMLEEIVSVIFFKQIFVYKIFAIATSYSFHNFWEINILSSSVLFYLYCILWATKVFTIQRNNFFFQNRARRNLDWHQKRFYSMVFDSFDTWTQ